MNEFTKEELNTIDRLLDDACELYREPDETYELRDKVRNMMDNYCEHNAVIILDLPSKKCTECKKMWERICE
jgi:predicted kinase